ncbi:MAG: cytochrome c [Rhodoferax sp.]|nr:cytochrome c [Rhodoferax sp.]
MKPALQIAVLSAAVIGGVFAGLVFFIGNPFAEAPVYRLRPYDAPTIALGEAVYARHCASCHGAQLQGQPDWQRRDADGRLPAPPHDASGHTWHHPDEVLFRITKHGIARSAGLQSYQTSMPIYDGVLTDAEIVAALSWIKSQWPANIRAQHDSLNQAAAR